VKKKIKKRNYGLMAWIYIMVKKTRLPTPTFPKILALFIGGKGGKGKKQRPRPLKESQFEFDILQENITYLVLHYFTNFGFIYLCKALNMSTSLFSH
jgi:hypothetical protein